jgi:hypothetical protein
MKSALETLDYKVYHMASVFRTPGHASKWEAALKAKYEGKGSEFGREEFDTFLGDYDVGHVFYL